MVAIACLLLSAVVSILIDVVPKIITHVYGTAEQELIAQELENLEKKGNKSKDVEKTLKKYAE